MKKFVLLLISLTMLISVFLVSACGKTDEGGTSANESSSSIEESSSSGKISRNLGGTSASAETDLSTDISETSTQIGTSQSTEGQISGDSFYPSTNVTAPDGVSSNVALLIMQITSLEITPSNYLYMELSIKDAEDFYNTLTPSEKEQVINYNDLVSARNAYNKLVSQATIKEFLDNYETFDKVTSLDKSHVALVAGLKSTANSLTSAQTAEIADFASKKSKIESAYESLKSQGFMQFTFIADDQSVAQSTFFIFSNSSPETGSTGQDKFTVDGKYVSNTVRFNFGETITFNSSISGNLKIYCSNNDRTVTCTHDDGTAIVETKVMLPDADDNNYREFNLPKAGNYTLSLNEGEIFIYAIILTA